MQTGRGGEGILSEEMAEKRTTNLHLKEQMLELKERLERLADQTVCPECRQALTPARFSGANS